MVGYGWVVHSRALLRSGDMLRDQGKRLTLKTMREMKTMEE